MPVALLASILMLLAPPAPASPSPSSSPSPIASPTAAASPAPTASPTPKAPAHKPGPTPTPEPVSVLFDTDHDGSDMAHAIVIHAPTEVSGNEAEFHWLTHQRCGNGTFWLVDREETISGTDKTYDRLDLHCSDGSALRSFYFDITDFAGKS